MQVLKILHEVGAQAVPVIAGEEAHVVEVDRLGALQEDAHETLRHGLVRLQLDGVLLPFVVANGDALSVDGNILIVDNLHTNLRLLALQVVQASIDREVVSHVFLQAHAEEATVLKAGNLLVMASALKRYVVGVAVESRLHVTHGDVAEGAPTHQAVGKLKTAVLNHLCIETAIGSKVNVLKEDSVHG